jgi:hypothetical protein
MDPITAIDLATKDYIITLGHACMTEQEVVLAIRTSLTKNEIKTRLPQPSPLRDAYYMIMDVDEAELVNALTTSALQGARLSTTPTAPG